MKDHRLVLHRVGWVLIIGGLVDICYMVYCIANQHNYSSSFNIFAVVAGIFLLKGSLKAARTISQIVAFFIAVFAGGVIIVPFWFPLDLLATYFKLSPVSTVLTVTIVVFIMGLFVWIYRSLTSAPIRAAMDEAQVNYTSFWRRPVRGFWVGSCLAAFLLIFFSVLIGGNTAEQAKHRAATQIGSGYKFHVKSLNISAGAGEKHVHAVVTAYNDSEIKEVVVEWSE